MSCDQIDDKIPENASFDMNIPFKTIKMEISRHLHGESHSVIIDQHMCYVAHVESSFVSSVAEVKSLFVVICVVAVEILFVVIVFSVADIKSSFVVICVMLLTLNLYLL